MAGYSARVWLGGQELQEVTRVSVDVACDDVVRVDIGINVSRQLDFQADATVTVFPFVVPGWKLVEEQQPNGRKVYRAEPDPLYAVESSSPADEEDDDDGEDEHLGQPAAEEDAQGHAAEEGGTGSAEQQDR